MLTTSAAPSVIHQLASKYCAVAARKSKAPPPSALTVGMSLSSSMACRFHQLMRIIWFHLRKMDFLNRISLIGSWFQCSETETVKLFIYSTLDPMHDGQHEKYIPQIFLDTRKY
jgi:hypothetical protein